MKYDAIVLGASAGGIEALSTILPELPADFDLSIIVVSHMHPTSGNFLACIWNDSCRLDVKQVAEKESIVPGVVYFAPPNYHLMVEDDRTFSLSIDAPVNFARPSIDVLFETAADVYGERLVGIILTGANYDGSYGLKRIKESGGLAVVQDPETAEVDSMPRAAIAATEVDHILPLDEMGPFICRLAAEVGN